MQARGGGAAQLRGGETWLERDLAGDRRRRPGGAGEHHGGGGEHHGGAGGGWSQHFKHKSFSTFRTLRKSLLIYLVFVSSQI